MNIEELSEWSKKHMKTVSTRINEEDYYNLKSICESQNISMHQAIRLMVAIFLRAGRMPLKSKKLKRDFGEWIDDSFMYEVYRNT